MISRLIGVLVEKKPPFLLVDVNGVGYEVAMPLSSFHRLPALNERVSLHTHFVVREDGHMLYGFMHTNDRQLFRELIKVNGVGPKLALGILSGIETPQFIECVQLGDSTTLCRIPGIGKKTAERLLIEMRDAMTKWSADVQLPNTVQFASDHTPLQDALSALLSLGYKEGDARRVLSKMNTENKSAEVLIREVLKKI